jgi:hypothetical protein
MSEPASGASRIDSTTLHLDIAGVDRPAPRGSGLSSICISPAPSSTDSRKPPRSSSRHVGQPLHHIHSPGHPPSLVAGRCKSFTRRVSCIATCTRSVAITGTSIRRAAPHVPLSLARRLHSHRNTAAAPPQPSNARRRPLAFAPDQAVVVPGRSLELRAALIAAVSASLASCAAPSNPSSSHSPSRSWCAALPARLLQPLTSRTLSPRQLGSTGLEPLESAVCAPTSPRSSSSDSQHRRPRSQWSHRSLLAFASRKPLVSLAGPPPDPRLPITCPALPS